MVFASPFLWLMMIPLAGFSLVYLIGRAGKRLGASKASLSFWMALLALLVMVLPLYQLSKQVLAGQTPVLTLNAITLRMDGVGLLLSSSVLALAIVVTLFSYRYVGGEEGEEKYYALLLAMSGVIIGLGCAADLFNLWVWFEAMAVTSYLLVAFYRNQPGALEAGVKYVIQSACGSVLVVLGIALVFTHSRSLDLLQIPAKIAMPAPLVLAAGVFFVVGFGVKSALVPLHTWLPDAHSQAPSGISAMLSGVVIEAGLVALLRSLGVLSELGAPIATLLLIFAVLNMLVGNLMALRQTQVKRLLAFSSVSHVGYMLLGLAAALGFGAASGASGSFFHILTHALMKGLAFLSAGLLLYCLRVAAGSHEPLTVDDLAGAAKRYPLAAFAFSVAVLGLGGLPPLAGFMSKWQIFVGGFQTHSPLLQWLVVFAALNSVLSLGYYAPLVNRIYRKQPGDIVLAGKAAPFTMNLVLLVLSLAVVLLGFAPGLVNALTESAAVSLLSAFGL